VWRLDLWGGQPQGSLGRLYRARRGGEGAMAGPLAINAMAGAGGFKTFKRGGGLNGGGGTEGIDGGNEVGALAHFDGEL
jgi:hypothetical protein